MTESLLVHEIFLSIQGESTFAGLPCAFDRLTGGDLRCFYCDTVYAFKGGKPMRIDDIVREFENRCDFFGEPGNKLPLMEITGGEPMLQKNVHPLMRHIMDLKCPSSGESDRMLPENIAHLKSTDEVKFVIGTEEYYGWAKGLLTTYRLAERCPVLFSWVAPLEAHQRDESLKPVPDGHTPISRRDLVERITRDRLPDRFQLQMHKFIWPPDEKGV